jgi:predicted PurR-regulated permease PerM
MTDRRTPRQEAPGPSDFRDPLVERELVRASVWMGLALGIALIWLLAQPILLIIGGLVFAAMLDGGTRLLGRVLPIKRGWRLAIVCVATLLFLLWTVVLAGTQLADQAETLRTVIMTQINRLVGLAQSYGLIKQGSVVQNISSELMGSIGKVTSFVGNALGAISSLAMIVVIGVFVAVEPKLYERGFAWMLPMESRARFYDTAAKMGYTLRRLMAGRLLGMTVEGVGVGVLLAIGGVPMATLLGVLTGLLAFLPNIGAIVSGILIVLVGFSGGMHTGIWAVVVYLVVQTVDGYIIVPTVAKRSVDLAPALVLGMQVLMGALFGILGLALADPIVAMIKVMLESRARHAEAKAAE